MRNLLTIAFLFISCLSFGQYSTKDSTGKSYINFNSLDQSLSCDSINKLTQKFGSLDKIDDPDLRLLAIMAQIQCSVTMLNNLAHAVGDSSHYQAQVVFTEENGNPRVLFNLIDLKSLTTGKEYAKFIVNFAPVLLAGSTGPVGDFLMETGIATAVGKYSIDAYYESAIKNDPLIILYPSIIPAKKFSQDVMKELKKNNVYNEVSKVWEQPQKTIINPVAKIAISSMKEVVKGTENVTRETKKATENIIRETKKIVPKIKW